MTLKDTNEIFADDLRDPAYAAGYLSVTLEDDGVEGFLYALQKVARAHGVSKVANGCDLPRESLYRALSQNGNPGIKPLARVLEAVGLRLAVVPASAEPVAQGHAREADSVPIAEVAQTGNEIEALRQEMQRLAGMVETLVRVQV